MRPQSDHPANPHPLRPQVPAQRTRRPCRPGSVQCSRLPAARCRGSKAGAKGCSAARPSRRYPCAAGEVASRDCRHRRRAAGLTPRLQSRSSRDRFGAGREVRTARGAEGLHSLHAAVVAPWNVDPCVGGRRHLPLSPRAADEGGSQPATSRCLQAAASVEGARTGALRPGCQGRPADRVVLEYRAFRGRTRATWLWSLT